MNNDTFDTSPLPGVKANDPKTGADDPNLSDEEIAKRLKADPNIDSRDGVVPDDTDSSTDPDKSPEDVTPVYPAAPAAPHRLG